MGGCLQAWSCPPWASPGLALGPAPCLHWDQGDGWAVISALSAQGPAGPAGPGTQQPKVVAPVLSQLRKAPGAWCQRGCADQGSRGSRALAPLFHLHPWIRRELVQTAPGPETGLSQPTALPRAVPSHHTGGAALSLGTNAVEPEHNQSSIQQTEFMAAGESC